MARYRKQDDETWVRTDGDDANIYDGVERVVGEWFGKPLYRKAFVLNNTNEINVTNLNILDIVELRGTWWRHDGTTNQYKSIQYRTEAPAYQNYGVQIELRNKNSIYIALYGYNNTELEKINLIIEYTKTTD